LKDTTDESLFESAAALIRAHLRGFYSVSISILVIGCRRGNILLSLEQEFHNSRIVGVFEEDKEFLLAERLLRNSPNVQAIERSSFQILLMSEKKFHVILNLNSISTSADTLLALNDVKELAAKNGVILIRTIALKESEMPKAVLNLGLELKECEPDSEFAVIQKSQ
jgi:hypothetical protein